MTASLRLIRTFCLLDLLRYSRQKGAVVSIFLLPLMLFYVIGSGASAMSDTGVRYVQFILPGVTILAVTLTTSVNAARYMGDRMHGFLRLSFLAPISRSAIFVSKLISSSLLSFLHAMLFLLLFPVASIALEPRSVAVFAGVVLLVCVALNAIALALASLCTAYESLQVMISCIHGPLAHVSTAYFPLSSFPEPLRVLVSINPISHALDAMRHSMLSTDTASRLHPDFAFSTDLSWLAGFTLLCVLLSYRAFRDAA